MLLEVLIGAYIGGYVVCVRKVYPVLLQTLGLPLDATDRAGSLAFALLIGTIWPAFLAGKLLIRGLDEDVPRQGEET